MLTCLATALLLAAKLQFVSPDANFSLREGLPAVQVLSLHQDGYGALWAGTTAGLAELGGPGIVTFGPEQGLSRSAVFAIAEAPSGAIIVGTAGGISQRVGERFEPMTLPAAAATLAVRAFARGGDGALWALAGQRTILRHLGDQWHGVGIDDALAFEATDFAADESGALWLATRKQGLLRLTSAGTRLQKSAQFQVDPRNVVSIDRVVARRGKVYFTSTRGLSILSMAPGGTVETTPFPEGASTGHRALSVTAEGRVFVGTNAGIFTLEGRVLAPVESRNDRARASVVSLLNDREGQLWAGTAEEGLHVLLMGRGVRFLSAGKESFRSIDVDRNGVHWISNEQRVLTFRTDGAGNPASVAEARFEGFDALTIYGIEESPGGGLLFAMEGGVGHLTPASRAVAVPVIRHDPRFEILRDQPVTGIHRDKGGALWAISSLGVYRLENGGSEAQSVPLSGGTPSMAAMDAQGSLWVITHQGAMDRIDTATEVVTSVKFPDPTPVEFVGPSPDGGVVATFADGRSALFFADGRAPLVITSQEPDGISWLSARSLQKMGERYLAAHGGDRLSQVSLNPPRVEQTILTSADLEDSDFRYLTLREGRAGQVWFSLLNGIGLLEPPNAPPLPGRLRLDPDQDEYVLGPRPNLFDLRAQLSDPVAPRKARYRHRLLGESALFSTWSSDSRLPLANVAPGEYTLEVEAEDRYGRRANVVSRRVVARAHPWESWPFRISAALLALLAAYGLYRRRVSVIQQDRLRLAAAVKAGRADLEIANQRLQELSLTDVLTGLRNRRYFSEVVEDEIRLLNRRFAERREKGDLNRDAVFFLLDLDHFKLVNDLFGHAGGDAVLKETARRVGALLRKTDRFIRWGGEEFLVLSLDCQRGEAAEMATRMMSAISKEAFPIGPEGGVHITTSLGFAAYPLLIEGADPQTDDVVRLADRALYRAKRAGRNCAVRLSPAGEEAVPGEEVTGTVEFVKDLGVSVNFTLVPGAPAAPGRDLASIRDSGPVRRLF